MIHGVWAPWKPYAYCIFGRYKEVCERGGFIDSLEKACCKFLNCIYVLRMWHSPLCRTHLHPMSLILFLNLCAKPWDGLCCVVMVMHDM